MYEFKILRVVCTRIFYYKECSFRNEEKDNSKIDDNNVYIPTDNHEMWDSLEDMWLNGITLRIRNICLLTALINLT